MKRLEIYRRRLNKAGIKFLFTIVVFSLLISLSYYTLHVRTPIVNLPTAMWISEIVGTKYLVTSSILFVVGYIPDAVEIVRKESNELQAERDAFDAFIDEVDAIAPKKHSRASDPQQSGIIFSTPKETGLQEVRQAYEETVMMVSHYEKEYGDTIAESLTKEFSPEIASQLLAGRIFTPLVKEQLMEAARQSRREREQFLSTLESEQEALHAAQTKLEDIDAELERIIGRVQSGHSLNKLIESYNNLTDAEETCKTILDERQHQRVDGHAATPPRVEIADIYSYLYSSLPVTYPVLADTIELLERLQQTQKRLAEEISARS